MDAALGARRPQRRHARGMLGPWFWLERDLHATSSVRYQVPTMTADAATGGYAANLTVGIA